MDKEMKIELINNGEEDLKIREYDQSGKEYKDYTLVRSDSLNFECHKLIHSYKYICENEKIDEHIFKSDFTKKYLNKQDIYQKIDGGHLHHIQKFVGKEFVVDTQNLEVENEDKSITEIIYGDVTLESNPYWIRKPSFSPFCYEFSVEKFRVYFRKRQKKTHGDEYEEGKSVELRYNQNHGGVPLIELIILVTDDEFEKVHNLIKFSKSHILKGVISNIYGIYYDEDSYGEDELVYKFLKGYESLEKFNNEKYLPPFLGPVGRLSYNLETF